VQRQKYNARKTLSCPENFEVCLSSHSRMSCTCPKVSSSGKTRQLLVSTSKVNESSGRSEKGFRPFVLFLSSRRSPPSGEMTSNEGRLLEPRSSRIETGASQLVSGETVSFAKKVDPCSVPGPS